MNTTVELTKEDALLFVEFQKRHALFALLESLGAFAIRNGSVTINFDSMGAISSVNKHETFRP